MKKFYPYLINPYGENLNTTSQKNDFLETIDNFINQKQYVKITLLNWQEEPIKEIQGELSGGSITKDGSSSVRRTCNLQTIIDGGTYTVEDGKMDFAINKKIFVEVGIKNYTNKYSDYPILWFPQGVFFISTFSISVNTTGATNINLSLKDKMMGLNGEVGGTFTATTILDELDTQLSSGEYATEKVLVYDIIQEVVHHIGGEPLHNIVIEDVPLQIKRIVKWGGDVPVYIKPSEKGVSGDISLQEKNEEGYTKYVLGQDIGYTWEDFVYTGELTAAPGESVTIILDKIKNFLGNYEYFYDVFGVFHFREIKNYLNTTQGKNVLADTIENQISTESYLTDITVGKNVYSFSNNKNLISLSVSPQYQNIKNDFVVQGLRQMEYTEVSSPIRYHLAIDKKPMTGNVYKDLLLYLEEETMMLKGVFPKHVNVLPDVGDFNLIYAVGDSSFFYWSGEEFLPIKVVEYYSSKAEEGYRTKDWRTEIYLQGLLAKNNGTDANSYYIDLNNNTFNEEGLHVSWIDNLYATTRYETIDINFYFEELEAFWPLIYDLKNQKFYGEKGSQDTSALNEYFLKMEELNAQMEATTTTEEEKQSLEQEIKKLQNSFDSIGAYTETTSLTEGVYFLDFIDPNSSALGEYAVNNIGRRSQVVANDEINCLFEPYYPDLVFVNIADANMQKIINSLPEGQAYIQVPGDIYDAILPGGISNAAFDQIKYELYVHTNYQKTVSITALPAWYLEPNIRADISDKMTNTYGNYVIKNINLTLGAASGMTVSASECFERF